MMFTKQYTGGAGSDPQVVDIAGLTPAANAVIIGNGTNFVTSTAPSLPITGVVSGVAAAAGIVGELIEGEVLSSAAVSILTATSQNVTSVALSAGQWLLSGNIGYVGASGTLGTQYFGAISETSATLTTRPGKGAYMKMDVTAPATAEILVPVGSRIVNIASPTTYYLVGRTQFTVSTMTIYGYLSAMRVR